MIEVERKFRLNKDLQAHIEEDLRANYGATVAVRQVDEVFLQGITSFADFKQGMPVARLRTIGGRTEFAYKRQLNYAGDMMEHEMSLAPAANMRAVLEDMGFHQVTLVDKTRLEANDGRIARMVDVVVGLPDAFLEVEIIIAEGGDKVEAERQIMEVAAGYGLSEADIEPRKYDQLVVAAS